MVQLFRLYKRRPVKIKAVEVTQELLSGTATLPSDWSLVKNAYINVPGSIGHQPAYLGEYIIAIDDKKYSVISNPTFREHYTPYGE